MRWSAALPKEHGAWALLLGSIAIAYAHPFTRSLESLPLAGLMVVGFAFQQPLRQRFLGRGSSGWFYGEGAAVVLLATLALLEPATRLPALRLLAVGAVAGGLDHAARTHGHGRAWALRLFGTASLTWILPELWMLGRPDAAATALLVWAVVVVWFSSRLAYLRLQRVPDAQPRVLLAVSTLPWWTLLVAVGLHGAPVLALLALVPAPLFATPWRRTRSMRTLGLRELTAFGWLIAVLVAVAASA